MTAPVRPLVDPDATCDACACPGCDTDPLWKCADCGRALHFQCSGASDSFPDLCDDCAYEFVRPSIGVSHV